MKLTDLQDDRVVEVRHGRAYGDRIQWNADESFVPHRASHAVNSAGRVVSVTLINCLLAHCIVLVTLGDVDGEKGHAVLLPSPDGVGAVFAAEDWRMQMKDLEM
jgi:hypothetical protein